MIADPASFRDPSGRVYRSNNDIYRSINPGYQSEFIHLNQSGLYDALIKRRLLVPHEECAVKLESTDNSALLIKQELLPLISYPYEWSFSQLKAAALTTLEINQIALNHGMILKDASAFNVQFWGTDPVFIDTLSFSHYREGQVWMAYRQFCEHFLGPLLLASTMEPDLLSLLKLNVDGIPLKLVSRLLPARTWVRPFCLLHIHMHARSAHMSVRNATVASQVTSLPKKSLLNLLSYLSDGIAALQLRKATATQWGAYDREIHYSSQAKESKKLIITDFVQKAKPGVVHDLGANDGYYSRIIATTGCRVLSLDGDPLAIEKNYLRTKADGAQNVYPLLFDITNPTPSIGWANQERPSLLQRSKPELIMVLAVIHHLVITHNIPFEKVAEFLSESAPWLIIEFVPPEDEKILLLPETGGKESYNFTNFNDAFDRFFDVIDRKNIVGSGRTIFLMKRRDDR